MHAFVAQHIYYGKIPQHTKKHGRKLLPHPFLPPHRQIDAYDGCCLSNNMDMFSLPGIAEMDVVREEGPLSVALCRLYVDGVDTGGKSRKTGKQVYVFLWTPLGESDSLSARRLITVMPASRCCKSVRGAAL